MRQVKTIGNATLTVYEDNACLLATDPWMGEEDHAYFGSWNLSHKIPEDIKNDIYNAKFIWLSHGHPDHLNPGSIKRFKKNKILLPDHFGDRIKDGLQEQGFDVTVIPDRKWMDLSDNIKIFCITTVIQDAVLLIDVNGHLFVNLNDAGTRGCTRLIKSIVKNYKDSYLLALSGYGDADMIHFYDENGKFVKPPTANKNVGKHLSYWAKSLGINHVIPFSSFHQYQRQDSIWAKEYTTPVSAYQCGFDTEALTFVPAFSTIDCHTKEIEQIEVVSNNITILAPESFGDNWNDELTQLDIKKIQHYFEKKETVRQFVSFINFRVGGKDNFIRLQGKKNKGVTFEVPRNSLMIAIEYEIFDDLLIGNFMKTTLHNMTSLYEKDFSLYITKYADNGRAENLDELEKYFNVYNSRIGAERFYEQFVDSVADRFRSLLFLKNKDSIAFSAVKKIYYYMR